MKIHTPGYTRPEDCLDLQTLLHRHYRDGADARWLAQVEAEWRARQWLAQRHAGLDMVAVEFDVDDVKGADDDAGRLADQLADRIREVEARGFTPKPVLMGPLSLLWQARLPGPLATRPDDARLGLLPSLVDRYRELLVRIEARAVGWIQVDEPILSRDLPAAWLDAFEATYGQLARPHLKILLATCAGSVAHALPRMATWPVAGLHVDLVGAPEQAAALIAHWPAARVLSAGIIDGQDIWRSDLRAALGRLRPLHERWGERLWLALQCAPRHDRSALQADASLDEETRNAMATPARKFEELAVLRRALLDGEHAVRSALDDGDRAWRARRGDGVRQGGDLAGAPVPGVPGVSVTSPMRVSPAFWTAPINSATRP